MELSLESTEDQLPDVFFLPRLGLGAFLIAASLRASISSGEPIGSISSISRCHVSGNDKGSVTWSAAIDWIITERNSSIPPPESELIRRTLSLDSS